MSEITRRVSDIVSDAAEFINIVDPDQDIPANILQKGTRWLNYTLDSWAASDIYVPFRKIIEFNVTSGTQAYYFGYCPLQTVSSSDSIISIENMQLISNTTKYWIKAFNVPEFERNTATTDIKSVPDGYYFQRYPEYSVITFSPIPSSNYTCKMYCKVALTKVSERQILDSIPEYAHKFLVYIVAKALSSLFPSSSWDLSKDQELEDMKKKYCGSSDFTMVSHISQPFGNYKFDIRTGSYR